MKKRYKRKNTGYLRRTSRIYLTKLNNGKTKELKEFLILYANIVRYFVEMLWSKQDFSNELKYDDIKNGVKKFNITARVSSMAYKQGKEIVNSQINKSNRKKGMPLFRNITANIDSRFFVLDKFNGYFDWCLRFQSGLPKIIIPFNNTAHTLKFLNKGWTVSNSIRLGIKNNKLFIDLIFEKERPEKKKVGEIIGIDTGYRSLLATSNGELIGTELKDKIKRAGKRRKSFHHYIETEINRNLKKLNLDDIRTVVVENLKNVKKNKSGKFSRYSNRLLSFWHYNQALSRLRQLCEEEGVSVQIKSPYKTSQRCPYCGKIDRRNRNGERFICINCGYKENADIVGALNLKALGLAEVYSLRLLQSQDGINVH